MKWERRGFCGDNRKPRFLACKGFDGIANDLNVVFAPNVLCLRASKMKINELQLPETLLKALQEMGYEEFTAIQEMTLPALLAGQDVLGEAPTGTGKTAAYALPMIVGCNPALTVVQSLVVCPTRELAIQVVQELAKFAKYIPTLHYVAIYGGQKISTQLRALKAKPQIIVGTPGRLNDLLNQKALDFSKVHYLVLDECDEMLEMGFIKDVNKIIAQVTAPHQTALFSATISNDIMKVAERYLKPDVKKVQIKRTPTQENQIAQKYVRVGEKEKTEAVTALLNSLSFTRAFVFCRTKHKVKQLEKILQKNTSHAITSLQGNLSQNKRDKAMQAFRNYDADVMVATDIAARGIDVNDVDLVINYDIPEEDEFYLHRIGRTGRVDKSGVSYTFITPSETMLIKKYETMSHAPLTEYVIDKGNVMKKYLENLEPKLHQDLSAETSAIEEACALLSEKEGSEVTPLELAAVMLKEKMEAPASDVAQEKDYSFKHSESIERNKEKKRFVTDPANQRFFINIGFEDGANEENLKSFVSAHAAGVKPEDFADVYLKGTFSFFELSKVKADAVISGVENSVFEGKNVHVEKTERPSEDSAPREKRFASHSSHDSYHHSSYHHDDDHASGGYGRSSHEGYSHHSSSRNYGHSDDHGYGHSDHHGYSHSEGHSYGHSDNHDSHGYRGKKH